MVAAVQDAIQYTHAQAPSQRDYEATLGGLSVVTEELRGVFAYVGEESGRVGGHAPPAGVAARRDNPDRSPRP